MTTKDKVARRKLSLLQLAAELDNVSKACRIMGYSRQQFYEIRREVGLRIDLSDHELGPGDAERLVAEALKPENRPMLGSNCLRLSQADVYALACVVREAG